MRGMNRDIQNLLPLEKLDPLETPLCCGLWYRQVARGEFLEGSGIGWSSRSVRFQGSAPIVSGEAIELRLEGVRGVFPPVMVLAEAVDSRVMSSGRFELTGLIKGILTLHPRSSISRFH